MQIHRHIRHFLIALASVVMYSCAIDDSALSVGGEEVCITLKTRLDASSATRAIGDATKIDQLLVGVYDADKRHICSQETEWTTAVADGISLTLIEGRTYNIVLWAQDKDNTAYELGEGGKITARYDDYLNGGFAKMEELDAFCATARFTVGNSRVEDKGTISLSRPLAQFNFADNSTQPVASTHIAKVSFAEIPVSFNPFTGEVEMSENPAVFTFSDFPAETLSVDGEDYFYVSSNYLFVKTDGTLTLDVTLDLQNSDGTSIKTVEITSASFETNKKTNVLGSIVQQPQTWSVWDGNIPTQSTITADTQNRYIIDEAADIAWLGANASTLEEDRTFLMTKDIDMDGKSGLSSISLPAGSTFDGGDGHIIKGIRLSGAVFGNATDLTVKNLTIEDAVIETSGSHAGVLVNTLKGSSSFSGITISNSSVATTGGSAGGMIGYVSRKEEKDRTETLEVTFSGCVLNGVSIAGSASEGKFVGLLSGYDNNESISFDADCEADDVQVADYVSVYTKANNSAWADEIDVKYDGWLGHETYRRGKVTFAGVRMAPRWDGTTATAKADLLLYNGESNKYEVHSPFDLAGVRNATASPAALYLMENVDMFGQGADGKFFVHSNFTKSAFSSTDDNNFTPFTSIALLDGNNKGIYNLSLNTKGTTDRYAFILNGNNNDVHKNTSFHNCCTVVPHIVGTDNGQTVDKSYGATVVLSIGGATYTMDNVHAYGCKVFALQKTGIIAGRIVSTTKANLSNCSVDNCYIENYKCQEHKELFEESIVSAEFYSYGEIGALTGFINYNATITNCCVNNTTINAYGQSDQKGNIANIIKAGTIPGRHVNQFIGDIRSKEGYTVSISDCSVNSNKYSQDSHSHSKGTSVPIIGEAYCLGAKIFIIGQKGDKKGTVKVKNITIDGSKNFTSETSLTLQELM